MVNRPAEREGQYGAALSGCDFRALETYCRSLRRFDRIQFLFDVYHHSGVDLLVARGRYRSAALEFQLFELYA